MGDGGPWIGGVWFMGEPIMDIPDRGIFSHMLDIIPATKKITLRAYPCFLIFVTSK